MEYPKKLASWSTKTLGLEPLDGFLVAGVAYYISPPQHKLRNALIVGGVHGLFHHGTAAADADDNLIGNQSWLGTDNAYVITGAQSKKTPLKSAIGYNSEGRQSHTGFGKNLPLHEQDYNSKGRGKKKLPSKYGAGFHPRANVRRRPYPKPRSSLVSQPIPYRSDNRPAARNPLDGLFSR